MKYFHLLILLTGCNFGRPEYYKGSELQARLIASMPMKSMAFMQSCIGKVEGLNSYSVSVYDHRFSDCLERLEMFAAPNKVIMKDKR